MEQVLSALVQSSHLAGLALDLNATVSPLLIFLALGFSIAMISN